MNLTHTPDVNELYPHVSADGAKVCFLVDAGEGEQTTRDVYCMNVDGTGRQLVARGARDPCWTADDKGIIYVKNELPQFVCFRQACKMFLGRNRRAWGWAAGGRWGQRGS